MSGDSEGILEDVYTAKSETDLIAAYDVWAASYDTDLVSFGYKIPTIVAGFFGRHVNPPDTPILDAGAGTGMISEGLSYLGYHGITAIDLSDGMLAVARQKGIYDRVLKMRLGDRLDFDDATFAATVCAGTLHRRPCQGGSLRRTDSRHPATRPRDLFRARGIRPWCALPQAPGSP